MNDRPPQAQATTHYRTTSRYDPTPPTPDFATRVRILSDGTTVTAATTVAQHAGDIPIGTLRQIEKDMIPVFGEGWLLP